MKIKEGISDFKCFLILINNKFLLDMMVEIFKLSIRRFFKDMGILRILIVLNVSFVKLVK